MPPEARKTGPNAVTNYTSFTDTNGTACFTHWLVAAGMVPGPEVTILTAAGTARGRVVADDPRCVRVCVPNPRNLTRDIIIEADGDDADLDRGRLLELGQDPAEQAGLLGGGGRGDDQRLVGVGDAGQQAEDKHQRSKAMRHGSSPCR